MPYGYTKENKKLVTNPKEAEVVKLIYETYISTGSLSKGYEKLKQERIRDRKNKIFSKNAIYYILRNIIYTGKTQIYWKNLSRNSSAHYF